MDTDSRNQRMVAIPDIKCGQTQDDDFYGFGWSLMPAIGSLLSEFRGSLLRRHLHVRKIVKRHYNDVFLLSFAHFLPKIISISLWH